MMSDKTTGVNSTHHYQGGLQSSAVNKLLKVALWLGIIYWPAATVWAAKDWAWQVLERSLQAEGTVAYEGLREIVIFHNGRKVAGYQQKVQRAPDNCERIVVLHPPQQHGRLVVCDGRTRWEYNPASNRVIVSSVQSRIASLRASQQRLAAKYLGEGKVAGQAAYIIRISDSQGRPLRQLWIDKRTFVRLKTQRFAPSGQVAQSAYFTKINYQPTLARGLFLFEPPVGCHVSRVPPLMRRVSLEVAQKQAGFRAILPSYVPRGYSLERNSVAVTRHKDNFILWLPFSNGLDTFSIFQAPRCLKPPSGTARGQTWVRGKFCFTLVGPLSEEEIEKIRASMPTKSPPSRKARRK